MKYQTQTSFEGSFVAEGGYLRTNPGEPASPGLVEFQTSEQPLQ